MIIPKSSIDELLATEAITDTATTALHTVGKVANAVGTVGKAAITVNGTIGKSSITRMGKDSILEFPTIFSGNIDTDDQIAIAKMFERYYATLLVSIFSLRPSVSLNEYSNIAEYIKFIYNNNSIFNNFKKAKHLVARESLEEISLVDEEPSEFGVNATSVENPNVSKDLGYECWGVHGGALNMGSINEMVNPYKRTQALLNERITLAENTRAKATEAVNVNGVADSIQNGAMRVINVGNNTSNTLGMVGGRPETILGRPQNNAIEKNDKVISMAPTMINVSFYLHGSKTGANGNGASFTQNVVLGVKSMVRSVASQFMVSSLIEGSKSSNPIFKFISWTRGEYKLVRDLLFNVTEIKKKFKNKKDDVYGFLDMSQGRKEVDNVAKFAANRLLPYTTVVATDYEIAQAGQVTGVDLTSYRNAKVFMDKYYLLAFAIYNTSTKNLSVLYDGANDWEEMSMTYIQTTQKKDLDVTKALGNLASIR